MVIRTLVLVPNVTPRGFLLAQSRSLQAESPKDRRGSGKHQNHGSGLGHFGRRYGLAAVFVAFGARLLRHALTGDGRNARKWDENPRPSRTYRRPSFGDGSWSRSSSWRRPCRHYRLSQQAGVEAARWGLHAAGKGVRTVQFGDHWFIRRSVCLRQHGHPIAAARTRRDPAIGEKLFARMQACLFASPENLPSAPVREINQPRTIHFNHFCPLVIKARIVLSYALIVDGGVSQFVRGYHASGNDRIGINNPAISGLNHSGLRSSDRGKAPVRHSGLRPSPVIGVVADALRSQPKPGYADRHEQQEGEAPHQCPGCSRAPMVPATASSTASFMTMMQGSQLALQNLRWVPATGSGRVHNSSCSCRTRSRTGVERQVHEILADGDSALVVNVTRVRMLLHKST